MDTEMGGNASVYDREKELKAFDDTKSGVKGLADSGVTKLPRIFIDSTENHSHSYDSQATFQIPVIDLAAAEDDVIQEILRASESWGFFRLVNHSISTNVMDKMIEGVRQFHEQPTEVKSKYYTRDMSKKVVYNSNFNLYTSKAAHWRDTLFCKMPHDLSSKEELPNICRDIMVEYSEQVKKLGTTLMELISKGLGLKPSHLHEMGCTEGTSVVCHYSPGCPEPELTFGSSKHSDSGFLTVLLQDQIGGLQVLYRDTWIDIPPVDGSLLVNIGDMLQLVSNDKLMSSEHRVIAKKEGPRVSMACFFNVGPEESSSRVYGPIEELVSKDNPAKYRATSSDDYFRCYYAKGLDGDSALPHFKLWVPISPE